MKYLIFFISLVFVFSCRDDVIETRTHNHTHLIVSTNGFPLMPVPNNNPLTIEGVELGRKLFYDPILSFDNTVSCASCHKQESAFGDNTQYSFGVNQAIGDRHAPTIINVAFQNNFEL